MLYQNFLIALLIGVLVGVERERVRSSSEHTLGLRSFVLVALLGALAGWTDQVWLTVTTSLFVFVLIGASYWITAKKMNEIGLTTELAGGVVFFLGYLANTQPLLTVILGPLVALILFSKKALHRFTHQIKASELEAALLLVLLAVGVLGVLPEKAIDPWGLFYPKKFGLWILILGLIEFLSYLLIKIKGNRTSFFWIGILGGIVSSTMITIHAAREISKNKANWKSEVSTILWAQVSSWGVLLGFLFILSFVLFLEVVKWVWILFFPVMVFAFIFQRESMNSNTKLKISRSPLDWRGIFRIGILLSLILIVLGVIQTKLGTNATLMVSFLTGFFELHGVSLATISLYKDGHVLIHAAAQSILLAVLGSLVFKCILFSILILRKQKG